MVQYTSFRHIMARDSLRRETYMHEIDFIQDMAVIMLTAGFTTVLFHRIKQPVVLGYILAGILIGPYTPPVVFVSDQSTIKIFADLGVIFLMFSLGLEFSLAHLKKVGLSAFITALLEIVIMIYLGYQVGKLFGWRDMDALFLGAMLAISSTTIIIKVLHELKLTKEKFAQYIFGILIIEDILGIVILALLSGIGTSASLQIEDVGITIGKLILFLTVSLIAGILIIPRILAYVEKFGSHEMLLISVLGLCFGFCLLVMHLHYSVVLGAFVIGAIIAESPGLNAIEHLIAPLRDMFSAVFFVAIGLLLNPYAVLHHAIPILVITAVVIIGKIISCALGSYITGQRGSTSLKIGMGLAQIGEFSFIIASLGVSLNLTHKFLFSVAVAVSAITTVLTPYLIRFSDPLAVKMGKIFPRQIREVMGLYTAWLRLVRPKLASSVILTAVRMALLAIFLNLCIVTAIFLVIGNFEDYLLANYIWYITERALDTISWAIALLLSLPSLIAIYRKIKNLSLYLAKASAKKKDSNKMNNQIRRIISEIIPALSIGGIMIFISVLSASILPPRELFIGVLVGAIVFIGIFWRWLINLHTLVLNKLMKTLHKEGK